eukprot:TRINITY_DN9849_c0_g1_i1.p1 TRINITY_DN9849_c0_g1~~TRINITY_DN9849_c0_g1_i1.p1  ORF type:complete len:165 (+),score=36.14 TRINITY_DN9849_c0_g1_i1:43-537(+)
MKCVLATVTALLMSSAIAILPAFVSNFQIPAHNYAPEGMFWDSTSQQFLFGSTKYGGIYAVRPGFSDVTESTIRIVDPNNLGLGVYGVFVDYGSNRCNLWAALSNFSFTGSGTVDGGLLYVNMVTGVSSAVGRNVLGQHQPTVSVRVHQVWRNLRCATWILRCD